MRIIAVEQYGAGPFGTLFLSDMGAEIIKVEDPAVGGDISRYVPPGQQGTDSLFFETFNRGKRSLALDLKNEDAQGVLHRLVTESHALFTNLRGDLPEQLGLTYDALQRFNPAIVCVSLSAYGRTGGRSTQPGYDALVQAEAGWATLTGEPDGPPVKSGLSLVDYSAGLMAALALMVGVFDAQRTGRGRNIDTSLYDAALSLLTYPATWYLTQGVVTERLPNSAHPSIVPFQFFATADGHIAIACAKEKFFKALAAALQLPSDARFVSFESRRQNRQALTEVLSERFRMRPTAEWLSLLSGRVPIAPVRPLTAVLDPDELAGRNMLASYAHPTFGQVESIGLPLTFSGFSPEYRAGPSLNADRDSILGTLGYAADEITRLEEAGAFGSGTSGNG
ncbi:MAG TPA: CoA transferase [Candidatus Dormibacteraeota bacterium]|nr:CoA transferase [Candidatus Dormibacteraeota bacterium]